MSRVIKFKAWNERLQMMFTVYGIDFDKDLVFCESEEDTRHTFGMKDVELLQFTGFKDSNGVEIYEGDIWKRETFIAIVEFKYGQWKMTKAESSGCYQFPSSHSNASTGEFIGNIYQNKGLLE